MEFFTEIGKNNSKICVGPQKIPKKMQSWERTKGEVSHSLIQTVLQNYSNQSNIILA